MGSEAAVVTEADAGVLVITLNRPEARNAVNAAVARGIAAALDRLDADDELRVGILTGAGGSFCAGMDLKAFARGERPTLPDRGFGGLTRAMVRKPLIAAVEGWALGGGFELALGCDLIVAAEDAKFGFPEVKRGLVASEGGLVRLPRRIPYHVALRVLLTGDPLAAPEASEHGLVSVLTAPGAALDKARELAGHIAVNAPLALAAVKEIVRTTQALDDRDAFEHQDRISSRLISSEDAQEGARAFAEKRPPVWRGT
jgi:enoyl-CoA hydratase